MFSELLIAGDKEHLDLYQNVVENISNEYREKLNEEANEEYLDDIGDPFDPW